MEHYREWEGRLREELEVEPSAVMRRVTAEIEAVAATASASPAIPFTIHRFGDAK